MLLRFASIGVLAVAYFSIAELSNFLQAQPQSTWDALQITNPEHSPAAARLRRAFERCKAITQIFDGTASSSASPPVSAPPSVMPNVWAEHAPPRLDAESVFKMVQDFHSTYNGEHIDADSVPSIRLLSLVHCWFKPHGKIKWVPWQLRMSQREYQEIIEARTARTLRTEAQLISSALFDDAPELNRNHANLSPAWLARTQTIMRNAIALCKGAHLRVLKTFDKRMHELATQSLAAGSGLRTVSTQELLQADRKIWYEIASMHAEGWTLDQALHEITKIRSDFPALLQPRAKAASIVKGKPNKKGDGKGLAKVAKNQFLKDTAPPQLSAALQNLATKHGNKTLCLRYNRGSCTNKQCKFRTPCAIKLPNGQVCGQRRPAQMHRFPRMRRKKPTT